MDYIKLQKEFANKFNHYSSNILNIPNYQIRKLRSLLIQEEGEEVCSVLNPEIILTLDERNHIIMIADGLADLLYVTFGTALAYGIPIDKVYKEIHRSNMTKSMFKDEKSIKGKTLKGENYEPPNLAKILFPVFGHGRKF